MLCVGPAGVLPHAASRTRAPSWVAELVDDDSEQRSLVRRAFVCSPEKESHTKTQCVYEIRSHPEVESEKTERDVQSSEQ